jgi:uncharacterized protein (UPF0332 family)
VTTPEAADYLDRARRNLDEARAIAAIDLPDVAGRTAYLAAYHAAQALIFDRTGKVTKSHRGARSEFARLAKEDPRIDRAFTTFLARAYNLKEIADYGAGHSAGVTAAQAEQAIETAARLIDCISNLLSAPKSAPSADNGAKPG